MKKSPVICVVALSLMEQGLSGGDVRLRAMLQRWCKSADIIVFTSPAGKRNMESWGINVSYVLSYKFPESLRSRSDFIAQVGSYWNFFTIISRLSSGIRMPDVIYVQNDFLFEVALGVKLKQMFAEAKLVVLSHHSYREIYEQTKRFHHYILKKMQEFSFRLVAKDADLVTVLPTVTGDFCRDDLIKAGMAEDKIKRMRNGIDLGVLRKIKDVNKEYDACIIGLRRNKGLADVPVIWAKVCEMRPGSILYIIGSIADVDKEWLERELEFYGIRESINFGGHFNPPMLYKELKKAQVCIAPTHQEPYGIAICEAMACGLPVVGYNLENYKCLHSGVIETVTCFDCDKFARYIVALLDDVAGLHKKSEVGKEHMLAFDNDIIAKNDLNNILTTTGDYESF